MRISDWSSDVCSSDLGGRGQLVDSDLAGDVVAAELVQRMAAALVLTIGADPLRPRSAAQLCGGGRVVDGENPPARAGGVERVTDPAGGSSLQRCARSRRDVGGQGTGRSEEHTSELQSLMRTSYDVFCL